MTIISVAPAVLRNNSHPGSALVPGPHRHLFVVEASTTFTEIPDQEHLGDDKERRLLDSCL
ncbi:hypothetical protein [Aliiglaciecola litoralis]|uniref:hypothetical protein n=1 Tax=Aliiglaciecola litoralis TaxID=582857 RepID=UPI0031D10C9A